VFLVSLGLLAFSMLAFVSCGGGPKTQPETPPIDTTPVVEEPVVEVVEEPPPPPPQLKESQFQTIYFDLDKFNLKGDARSSVDHNYQMLNEFPDVIVKIEGHCDERGTVEYNISLGEKRAKAAMDYMVGLGIEPNRITTISYGKERPVDAASNEAAWSKNRRCEFRIVSQ